MNHFCRKSICCLLALAFCTVQIITPATAAAQAAPVPVKQSKTPLTAPLPTQIVQAKTVFLSNAGADSFFLTFSDGKDRGYNELYAAIKPWSRYQLVPTPAQADLILEIKCLAPSIDSGNDDPATVIPQIRLQFLDPATHTVLWTLTSYVHAGLGTQSVRDKQFDQAANGLFDQLRQLTGETLTPAEAKTTHTRPGISRGTKILIISLAAAGILTTGLLAYHFSQQKLPPLTQPTPPACTFPFCPVP